MKWLRDLFVNKVDVNKDGKVDSADLKVATENMKQEVVETVAEVKEEIKEKAAEIKEKTKATAKKVKENVVRGRPKKNG